MKGMAKKISNRLSQIRSNFLFKASRMKNQSKINFKRKKSQNSELSFSKYKRGSTEFKPGQIVKKTTFSKNKDGSQSSKIYSVDSITEIREKKNEMNKNKTTEILEEMEGVEDTPKNSKETDDNMNKKSNKNEFFGKISVFSVLEKKKTKKIEPVVWDDKSFDGIL